jgi:uroporphyrin-III C-methyltransferase
MTKNAPLLTLIGAGPGDPELITVKGLKALQSADVVMYDALVNPELLAFAKPGALPVFVGKQVGRCEFAQTDIQKLIVEYAFSHGHVVRLKGGDPFVFGRGYEEVEHASAFGIPVRVVPGVSSALAVPALQGIPLTSRGLSEGFWVLTGTTRHHDLSHDIAIAAQSSATLVILMGMKHLAQIMEQLVAAGRGHVPVAVVQSGGWPGEKVALGHVHNIAAEVARLGLANPAVIVVGEVVRLHPEFSEVEERVAQTRPRS